MKLLNFLEMKNINLEKWIDFSKTHNVSYFTNDGHKSMNSNIKFIHKPFGFFQPQETKVVILGQDPYPSIHDRNGLAFDVSREKNLPLSLLNILKKLCMEYNCQNKKYLFKGLSEWSKQGVLLLNTIPIFTTNKKDQNNLKQRSVDLLTELNKNIPNIIYIIWGRQAEKTIKKAKVEDKNCIYGVHPSPLSSYRGFFEKDYFVEANRKLEKLKRNKINWLSALEMI